MKKLTEALWWILCLAILGGIVLFALTDTWPYMHEVIWQQSWHPVCPLPNGGLEFCKP